MLSRAIHMTRFRPLCVYEPALISPNAPVAFNDTLTEIPVSRNQNSIIYDTTSKKFRILTTNTTQNNFFIILSLSVNIFGSHMSPTFAIHVESSNYQLISSFPASGSRTLDTLYGCTLVQLPHPTTSTPVYYYISLVNESQADCYYAPSVYDMASILIMSIDTVA